MVSRVGFRTIRWVFFVLATATASAATMWLVRAQSLPPAAGLPGTTSENGYVLPNGWRVAPVGKHLTLSTLPLNLITAPDGRYAVVTNNGLAKPSLSVVDLTSWTVKNNTTVDAAWYGLAWSPDGTKLYSSGAAQNTVQEFTYAAGTLKSARTFALPAGTGDTFTGGLAVSPDGAVLFATRLFASTLSAIDLASGQVQKTVPLSAEPYSTIVSPDGRFVYVSLWGGARVEVFAADSLRLVAELSTDEHPNAMVLAPDGRRIFIACANSSSIWVYDTFSYEAIEQISVSVYPNAPPSATPNALALSPDGRTLVAALADNNAVAVVDVTNAARSLVDGFIPTGWYPTAVAFSRDGKQILILDGKGQPTSGANPAGGGMDRRLLGTISMVAVPDRTTLSEFTRRVIAATPYSDAIRLTPANAPIGSPIPRAVGSASPIKHVFYVIRENRTYDQILGDVAAGNGDPTLTLFGSNITPNAHALAQSFVLFDNFYVDADVSYNGHSYSTAAYSTDFVEKIWQTVTTRGGPYLGEGLGPFRNPYGNLAAPQGGYLWDAANRAGVSVRSYGEFVRHLTRSPNGDVVAAESVPGLKGAVAPSYAGWDLDITDIKRVDTWIAEFRQFERDGNLPQLSIVRLPNDHTAGTKAGSPTPRAMMADNDLALGRLVSTISNSSVYWKDSAIFIVEDDAQSGPDHVDAHRSVLLVASPFARRSAVDHTFYTTSSVLRTIELILGLAPMSEYDASATPLYGAFVATPNLGAESPLMPAVALDEKNPPTAFGSDASARMDFSVEDRAPEQLLNEILWRSIKGAHSTMPPARRSVFVRPSTASADSDDDDGRR